jgi:hypothetical protein
LKKLWTLRRRSRRQLEGELKAAVEELEAKKAAFTLAQMT